MERLRSPQQVALRRARRDRVVLKLLDSVPTAELENAILHRGTRTEREAIEHVSKFPVAVIEQAYKNRGGVTSREAIGSMTAYQLWECLSARCNAAVIQVEMPAKDGSEPDMATWYKGSYMHCNGLANTLGEWARRRQRIMMDQLDYDEEEDDDRTSCS